jgi:hypothetical protein
MIDHLLLARPAAPCCLEPMAAACCTSGVDIFGQMKAGVLPCA